jgi:hypothetical protein
MIGITYTITNKAGASFKINDHVTDPLNFIALQAYPQFDVDIKNGEVNRDGQHGIWDFFSYYGRRSIGFQGLIVGEDETEVERLKESMLAVLGLPLQPTTANNGYVTLSWSDLDGNDWQLECKLSNAIQWNRQMRQGYRLEFNFTLKADDPFIYGQTLNSVVGIRGYAVGGGMFPLPMPALLGLTYVDTITIVNAGAIDAHTVIRIEGEAAGAINNPQIVNLTTGKVFSLSSVIADENSWIEIDSKLGTVVNQLGADLSGQIVGDSEFPVLASGTNELVYVSDEDPAIVLYFPTAPFTISYRNTKI